MEKKVKTKAGMIRFLGYGGILVYAVARGVILILAMLILLPLLWIKEKAI